MRTTLALSTLAMMIAITSRAGAVCRVVTEKNSLPPTVQPDQSVLFVVRHDVPRSGNGERGSRHVGRRSRHADRRRPGSRARLRSARRCITMVMQPSFSTGSGGSRFAMLMVTPAVPTVSLAPASLFRDLAVATGPKVEFVDHTVEDSSLGYQCNDPKFAGSGGCGGGGSWSSSTPPSFHPPDPYAAGDLGLPASPTTLLRPIRHRCGRRLRRAGLDGHRGVSADNRYEFPATVHVPYAQFQTGSPRFLTRNEMKPDVSKGPESDPIGVVVGNSEYRDVHTVIRETRIPSSQCPKNQQKSSSLFGCGCEVGGVSDLPAPMWLLLSATVLLMGRRFRRAR